MLFRHAPVYLLSRIYTAGCSFFAIWLFSRLFAPAEFGVYVTVMAITTMVNMSLLQWLRVTQTRYAPGNANLEELRQVILALFLTILFSISLAVPIGWLLPLSVHIREVVLFSVLSTIAIAWSEFSLNIIRTRLKPLQFLLFSFTRDTLQIVLVLVLLELGWRAGALIGAFVLGNLLPFLLWLPSMAREIWPPRFKPALTKELLRYGLPLAGIYSLATLITNMDRLLLPWLADAHAVGLYGAAYGIARQSITTLMYSINLASFPLAVHALANKGHEAAVRQMQQNFSAILMVGLPSFVGLATLAPLIANTLLGSDYVAAASHLIPWVAGAALLAGVRSGHADLAFQLGKDTRFPLVVMALTTVLALPTGAWFITHWGVNGAAYGTVLATAFALVLSWWLGQRVFAIALPRRDTICIVLASAAMALVLLPFRAEAGFIWLVLAIGVGGLVYGSLIAAFNVMSIRSKVWQRLRRAKEA